MTPIIAGLEGTMSNRRFDTSDRPSKNDIRFWRFRTHYPTGLRRSDSVLMQCATCEKTYGRHGGELPRIDPKTNKIDPCNNYTFGKRCMGTEYTIMQILEVEAMPIGSVRLPTKGREW
jgi:hypothetical protein